MTALLALFALCFLLSATDAVVFNDYSPWPLWPSWLLRRLLVLVERISYQKYKSKIQSKSKGKSKSKSKSTSKSKSNSISRSKGIRPAICSPLMTSLETLARWNECSSYLHASITKRILTHNLVIFSEAVTRDGSVMNTVPSLPVHKKNSLESS